jgi:hypothetical protein
MSIPPPSDPVQALLRARQKLIEQRRDLAASLGEEYQRGHTDVRRAQFIEVQQALEAIDRAIADEQKTR